ncbi:MULTISPECIES: ABC transporter permease [unclassified Herbaspirillum]|uniref:ABC transporter permease n=1 Tax=unclassified Herbaspirillum TaxID=2624150 RepID=UPI00115175E3|nr:MULTISPECIES: ABC transporter permease [unclassified Herbaspirillum]MBB5391392.1 putative spermidine/putrescine transport system permease protein [Herbaspirillum sp. SJZ102]TQK12923.1 putative spermidine/putrescine transport system permease protein [Herbaspirillum sp. SJZ130]TQK14927.1 putative spermidine/putrescine transport system permease protein [Herbaspirillum sp. SJZ106]TWC67282.1 putative spermidine/putrescine transport system permease protein [Herbaspirillum sp. SJZ099]
MATDQPAVHVTAATAAAAQSTASAKAWRLAGIGAGALVYVFLSLPVLVIFLSAFSPEAYPQFPPQQFSLRWFRAFIDNPGWLRALEVSAWLLLIATPVTTLLGTTAAYALARLEFPGRSVIQAFVLSPLIIPQVVLGIALLYVLTGAGMAGSLLGLAAGHIVVALPYAVRTVSVSLASMDRRLETASMNLGATPAYTFRHVTLPLIKPGIVAGAVFAAVTSFGEVSVSLFLTVPGTVSMPVRIFTYIDQTFDPVVNAVSAIFIVLAVLALVLIERTIGLTKAM